MAACSKAKPTTSCTSSICGTSADAAALELLRELQKRYPNNPLFLSQIAEIEDVYVHDIAASLGSSRQLLAQARRRQGLRRW
jgi:hypothetical protein